MAADSCKVTFVAKDRKDKVIRRFYMPTRNPPTYECLKEKLKSLFRNELAGGSFKLTWQDHEGDAIHVGSNEELAFAWRKMAAPSVYPGHSNNYTVRFTLSPESLETNVKQESTSPEPGSQHMEEHVGVSCFACQGPIIGHRYCCMTCPNYNLCLKCECKGIHPGHDMKRITTSFIPAITPSFY